MPGKLSDLLSPSVPVEFDLACSSAAPLISCLLRCDISHIEYHLCHTIPIVPIISHGIASPPFTSTVPISPASTPHFNWARLFIQNTPHGVVRVCGLSLGFPFTAAVPSSAIRPLPRCNKGRW